MSKEKKITAVHWLMEQINEILDIAYWEYMESMGEKEEKYWQQVKQELLTFKSE